MNKKTFGNFIDKFGFGIVALLISVFEIFYQYRGNNLLWCGMFIGTSICLAVVLIFRIIGWFLD